MGERSNGNEIIDDCTVRGCRTLETRCKDCGRLVSTADFKDAWISVKDKLPEMYEYVLVFAQMPGTNEPCPISIARYDSKKWEFFNDDSNNACACGDLTWNIESEEITHWMPLPRIPSEK